MTADKLQELNGVLKEEKAAMADDLTSVQIRLEEKITSANAAEMQRRMLDALAGKKMLPLVLDASGLRHISSAGLRVILRLRGTNPDITMTGVRPEVYEILEMTGFTEILKVEKAFRVISVEGCEEIGHGSNGRIYRIDQENVVKVYTHPDALEDIRHEREVARLALVLGIPTAISYDVVRVGDCYGAVFELLNARSFSSILAEEPGRLDWCVQEFVKLLKKLHATRVPAGRLPDMKKTALSWAEFMQDYLPEPAGSRVLSLIGEIPQDDHLLHGDFHTKNLELQNDEVLLIDMDTMAAGHPVFELASMYNAFAGFSELDHERFRRFQGYDRSIGTVFWHKALAAYLETDSPDRVREVEDKARIIGYVRLMRRFIRRGALDTEQGRAEIEHWKAQLLGLLQKTDTLLF